MVQDSVRPQLLSGEHVLWEGPPYAGLILRPIEMVLIPFSLFWAGFTIFWNVEAWTINANADLPFKLFGLPFLAAGLYITFGRFLLDMRLRRRLVYLVTDRRILILKQGSSATSKSLDIKRLPALELEERPDGAGTIRFGPSGNWLNGGNFGIWQPTLDPTPQFIRIANVRSAYELIQRQAG
jgi:hypothetical protein